MFGLDKLASIGLAPFTGGASLLAGGEDTVARIPVVGGLLGAETDSQKALVKKQQQLAEEARKRQKQNEQARLNALGQQMLAFNPQNQLMAQMFGPDAAFTPQQFAQMAADPYARSQAEFSAAHKESLASGKPMQGWTQEDIDRMQADQRRRAMVEQNMRAPGPGPAPIRTPAPQAARRF